MTVLDVIGCIGVTPEEKKGFPENDHHPSPGPPSFRLVPDGAAPEKAAAPPLEAERSLGGDQPLRCQSACTGDTRTSAPPPPPPPPPGFPSRDRCLSSTTGHFLVQREKGKKKGGEEDACLTRSSDVEGIGMIKARTSDRFRPRLGWCHRPRRYRRPCA